MTVNLENATFYALVEGERLPIVRSVSHVHDDRIHAALGTSSESELQEHLDNCYMGYWFDDDGTYKGEDCDGLGVEVDARETEVDERVDRV